jgi:formiminotetrahydrofolate cyclodeaminase
MKSQKSIPLFLEGLIMPDPFLIALAKPQPDPGGGAAAAQGALIGLALLEKIILLEQARVKQKTLASKPWENKRAAIESLFSRMEKLREQDRKIYPKLVRMRLSKTEGQSLLAVIEESITVPLEIMKKALEGLALISWVGTRCKKILVADLLVATELLAAALQGAFHIGSSNLPWSKETRIKRAFDQELLEALQKGMKSLVRVKRGLLARLGPEIQ